jgi:hypothetical protein
MKTIALLRAGFLLTLLLSCAVLQAQNYSGLWPIQDFNRHNAGPPTYALAPVNEGDTLAWIRFRGYLPDGKFYNGSNIMSWVTGPVQNNTFPANMVFRTNNIMRVTIADNGHVGVNTFLPEQLFTVSHPTLPVIRFDRSTPGERDFELFNGANGDFFFRGGDDDTGIGLSNFMVITHEGRVGVGLDAPQQLLTLSAPNNPVLRLDRAGADEFDMELSLQDEGNLIFRGGLDDTGDNLDELMRLTGSGKLAIGTTQTPDALGASDLSTYTLYANGGILTEEVRVRTGWADHVFEADYPLQSLHEVEQHIRQNGRLPDMPSTDEVVANGLELGDITVRQQVKIEEVYLHLLEMNREIQELKAENEQLKQRLEQLER